VNDLTGELRDTARELLEQGSVAVVIAYRESGSDGTTQAAFARRPEDTDRLVLNDRCFANLAVYLNKPQVAKLGRKAIVVKGCDRRALNVLMREHRVAREDLHIIGVHCDGVGEPPLPKCGECRVRNPVDCDVVLGETVEEPAAAAVDEEVARLQQMSVEERRAFWQDKLSDCIRCYACRQACPLCYCQRCVSEKNIPQWVEPSPHLRGNLAWHAARAFHLAGRCVGCNECERVCPMDIPLGLLNRKMANVVDERFDFVSGMDADEVSPFSTYDLEKDTDEGIL